MNELGGKLARYQLLLQEWDFEVRYRLVIVTKATDALSRLDSRANTSTPIDDEGPTMTISTKLGPSQSVVIDDDEDILPTREYNADINALSFPP